MAVTQNSYTGNGSADTYSFTFPYLKTADIKASIDATVTTAFTLPTATTLKFNSAPANGAKIKIYRETSGDTLTATFYAGSAIKSEDLNDNFTQNLYTTQEVNARFLSNLGGTMVGDLTMDEDADIVFEGATADAHETTLTVADPTADRTITLPNVTGTVVTTGDTGTVTSAMIADNTIVAGDIAANAVTASELADNAVDTAAIAADAVTGAKIADDQINSEHYVDGSIDTAHIADSQITTAKIANDAITQAKIADDAVGADQLAGNSVVSASIVDGTIVAGDIASNAITNAKMADDSVGAAELIDTSVGTAALASNAVTLAKMADSSVGTAELVADAVTGAKIADNAIDSEHYTDGSIDRVHLAADIVDGTKIADDAIDSEHYTDGSIDTAHIANNAITAGKIATDTITANEIANDAVTGGELANNAVDTAAIAQNAVTANEIATNAVTSTELADDAVTTDHIADAELTTLAGMQSGTASILAGGTALTATLTEINTVVDGKGVHTTISDSDAHYPTSGAVVDYVAAQIAPLGGLEVIATEVAFPNTQPASGVVISISDAGGVVFNGSGVSTTGRTVGSSTVTINGAPSSLYSETLAAGVGLMVSSTGSSQTYNYHKILGKEDDIKQLSDDINDFNARYRVNAGEPSSNNDDGDLVFDTNANKMKVYDATASAWKEVTSSGDFKFLVPVDAGTTTAATWDGSDTSFDLKEATNSGSAASITSVYQLMIVLNGVVQKPNTGTYSASEEGFYLTDSDTIRFCTAPPSGSTAFIIQIGSAITPTTPADNTVATAKIQNLAVTTAKIAADAVDGTKIADDAVGAEHIEDLDNTVKWVDNAKAVFGTGNDLEVYHSGNDSFVNSDTGQLYVRSDNNVYIQPANGEDGVVAIANGLVKLQYDNSTKLTTESWGVTVTGDIKAGDGKYLLLGDGNDLSVHHDGSHSWLKNNTGNLYICGKGAEVHIEMVPDAGTKLRYNDLLKLETTSAGAQITGVLGFVNTGQCISLGDSKELHFGTGDDLKIYHDGSHSYLANTTGNLYITEDGYIELSSANGGEKYATFNKDGAVELYHDNIKTFETRANGIKVVAPENNHAGIHIWADDGDDSADKWEILATTQGQLRFYHGDPAENTIVLDSAAAVELYYDNSKKLETTSGGITVQGSVTTEDINLSNLSSPTPNEVDGTRGNWTMQEGADDLFLINRVNGKKYKFNLTEVS